MKIRIAGVVGESVVDGPGIRYVVFTQGCPHHCPECHNPETHDFLGGEEKETAEIIKDIKSCRLVQGLTLSGGEPFLQPEACSELAMQTIKLGKNIVLYSGYTFEKLQKMGETEPGIRKLLELADILIDGPYIKEQRDLSLAFRGSRNQRIVNVRRSLEAGQVVERVF